MARKHLIRFEPVDVEIEVTEDQKILDAAFEQGIMLMHGCKEGQCAACKSYLLEGEIEDVDHDKYSNFALPDSEKDDGFVLLCKCHAYSDLTIELLNYDEEMIKSGLPLRAATTEVVSKELITPDMCHLVLRLTDCDDFKFFPGQFVDISVPGTAETRSFSMANISALQSGQLEFVIKIYPDGLFSRHLQDKLDTGDQLDIKGPYGMFTLRDKPGADLTFVGGGAGIAPILSVLRSMAERGIDRKVRFYYGARSADGLCFEDELRALEQTLPDFRYIPALSEPDRDGDWTGETGLITDVVERNEETLAGHDCYVCGPPPMVEAALNILPALGVDQARIFYDKFTTTGETE